MAIPLVLFHGGDCSDGFTAAWLAWKIYGDSGADYRAVNYGEPGPTVNDVWGRHVLILDFCFEDFKTLAMFATNAAKLTICDHHKTSEALLERVDYFAHVNSLLHVETMWSEEKSGAELTWEYFNQHCPEEQRGQLPMLVQYTRDRDLWLWKLPDSRAINAAIAAIPKTFAAWDRLSREIKSEYSRMVDQGEAILAYQSKVIDTHARNAVEIDLAGHRVLSVNATTLISEIGERLCGGRPFSATWFMRGDGKYVWSLRSDEAGLDVSEIAKQLGGGGHKHAAGFQVDAREWEERFVTVGKP